MRLLKKIDQVFFRLFILGSTLFFLGYEVIRAGRSSFTCDEAGTYLDFISPNVLALFNFNSANNHFLNSLLAKISSGLAGPSELALRLPNLLAYAVYLLFAFLMLERFVKNRIVVLCGYLLLSLNPYVLDFFSLCRGYGLSLGFLMASLFFFLTFLENGPYPAPGRDRALRRSLIAAGLAVLSSFSLLNVYLGLVILALGYFVVSNKKKRLGTVSAAPVPKKTGVNRILWPAVTLAGILFNLSAISQDLNFSGKFFEPLTIEIAGLTGQEIRDIQVLRLDIKNDEEPLIYQDGLWRTETPTYFTGLRFRGPVDMIERIEQIQIRIGPRTFSYDQADIKRLKPVSSKKYFLFAPSNSTSLKRSIIPAFKPVINWKGDQALLHESLRRMLFVLGIFVLAGGLLFLLGILLARLKILTPEQYRPLASITLALAIFIGYPLYILKQAGMLWWGGREGFIRDTIFSLINSSFYGKLYFRGQEWMIFFLLCLIIATFSVLFIISYRRKSLAEICPGLVILAILFLSSLSTMAQRFLLGNPYLTGRTALFMIPLLTLVLIFLCQALSRAGAALKALSITSLAALTALSVFHFSGRANTSMTVEWRKDADTKSMFEDLTEIKGDDFASPTVVRLGIDESLVTSLRYYTIRTKSTWLEIHIAPPYKGQNFYYVKDPSDGTGTFGSGLVLVKRYPFSGNILVKSRGE